MAWEAFSSSGTLHLVFPSCRMNSEEYQGGLEGSLLPFLDMKSDGQFVFQHGHPSVHSSRSTRAWFQRKSIRLLEWPACSPDLEPMGNIWDILSRRVYDENRQFSSVEGVGG